MNININPNSELHQSIVNVPDMVQGAGDVG